MKSSQNTVDRTLAVKSHWWSQSKTVEVTCIAIPFNCPLTSLKEDTKVLYSMSMLHAAQLCYYNNHSALIFQPAAPK